MLQVGFAGAVQKDWENGSGDRKLPVAVAVVLVAVAVAVVVVPFAEPHVVLLAELG